MTNARDHISLDEQARAVLRGNDRGGYSVPTDGLYPYQWNWDSGFAAWGFAQFDLPRAWSELETLFSGQWPTGMLPHILFHRPDPGYFPGPEVWGTEGLGPVPSSGISQPPVAATFTRLTYEKDRAAGRAHIEALYPKLLAWHRWFMQWRCHEGMIFVTHPWESGRDNTVDWDGPMAAIDPVGIDPYTRRDTAHVDPHMRPTKEDYDRYLYLVQRGRDLGWDDAKMADSMPFKVADPTMTFILLRANRDLLALAAELGEDSAEIEGWINVLEEGAERLRNPASGVFEAIDLKTGAHAGNVTSAAFLCWYAGIECPVMLGELMEAFEASQFPVPSQKTSSDRFDAMRYWRGPTWTMMNAITALGLIDMGHPDAAEELRIRSARLLAERGFAEYFNPHTGDPAGGGTFTWTAAIWLAWASPSAPAYQGATQTEPQRGEQ